MSALFVTGVSGSGKTTLGMALAERLGARFLEGDDFHPPANRAAMASGVPLSDDMRWPWLDALGAAVKDAAKVGPVVASCSGLKRIYRDRLRLRVGPCAMLMLVGDPALIRARLDARRGHFMPPALLESQLAALELPTADEPSITCLSVDGPLEALLATAEVTLKRRG